MYFAKAHKLNGSTTCGAIIKYYTYNAGRCSKRMNQTSAAYCPLRPTAKKSKCASTTKAIVISSGLYDDGRFHLPFALLTTCIRPC